MRSTTLLLSILLLAAVATTSSAQIAGEIQFGREAGFYSSPNRGKLIARPTALRPSSNAYINSALRNTYHWTCPFLGIPLPPPTLEMLSGQYIGYFSSDASSPRVGVPYYVHLVMGNVSGGFNDLCSTFGANMQLSLPANTYLAITQTDKVHCWYYPASGGAASDQTDCPQSLSINQANGYYYLSPNTGVYTLVSGATMEVQVPVVSTAPLSGSLLRGFVQALDGAGAPTDDVQIGVFVASNPPTITYPTPSATSITNTTARTTGNLQHHYATGNLYFDIGTTTAYGESTAPLAIPNTYDYYTGIYVDWSALAPGTLHHWRMRFVTTGGTTYAGLDQTFTTTGAAVSRRGDFDADGKEDIVLRNYSTGQNALWLMNGTAVSSIVDLPALTNLNYRIEGTGDFNADGKPDIVLRNYATGQDALWLMNGTAVSSIVDLPALPNLNYHFEGTGDFNADGKRDIILRNYASGQNALWLMNGTSFNSIVDLPALPNTAYKIESAADFNADGQTDIVLRNYTTGQNALWLMSATSVVSIVDLPALTNTAYRIDAIGDYNMDGKPDIVLRNYTTGQNALWIMNGTAVSSIVDLPALPNVNYEINGPR